MSIENGYNRCCLTVMKLKFPPPRDHQQGLLASMLKRSYADLVELDQQHWGSEVPKWEEFDRDVFEHPDTVGACVFLSRWGEHVVGFASYDPRRRPQFGLIGHNCVLPDFRGKGFGKQQIQEVIRRLQAAGIRLARASTGENPFFIPAQRMYTACGFREIGRHPGDGDPSQNVIEYEMRLRGQRTGATRAHDTER